MLENAKLLDKDFDSSASRSWATSTVINGATYVAGLFWQPLQNKEDPYSEIEESAESVQEGADLFAIKPGKTTQFGICASEDGYKKGMASLAVSVTTALSELSSFLAVVKVDNGWWYCCVRNDIILSDGDVIFLKEEDAKDQFMSMLAVPDWGRKYAPKEWGIPDTEQADIATLIANGNKEKLKKIKALRGPKLYAIIAVSSVIGFWILSSFVSDVLFAPTKRPVIVAPIKPKIMQPVVKKKIVLPWETLKNPSIMIKYCYRDTMNMVRIMPPGWKIGGLTCTDTGVTTSWQREVGRIAWVDKALNESGVNFAARSVSSDGKTVIASTYYKVPTIKSPPMYGDLDLKNTLNDLFQSLDVGLTLSDDEEIIREENTEDVFRRGEVEERKYKIVKFSFSSPQNPLVWMEILTKFSGLQVNLIRYESESGVWYYEGAIYVL